MKGWFIKVYSNISRFQFFKIVASFLAISVFLFLIITYCVVFHHDDPLGPDHSRAIKLVFFDLILFLLLIASVSHKLINMWIRRKRGHLGSHLQTKIILMFSVVAVIPTIVISGFSTLFFNYSIQAWFNKRVEAVMHESIQVAEAYLREHKRNIRSDILAISHYISDHKIILNYDTAALQNVVQSRADLLGLAEIIIFEPSRIVASNKFSFVLNFDMVPWNDLDRVDNDRIVIIIKENMIRAFLLLDRFSSTYIMVSRIIDRKVISHLSATKGAVKSYRDLQSQISSLQIQFSMIFILISLLLLLTAIWYGINFSGDIVRPLLDLFYATRKVQKGDLSFKIEEGRVGEEMSTLARAFNQMTSQLSSQRSQLIKLYQDMNERREFIEAVLSGVSSGIIAVNCAGIITLMNDKAKELLAPNDILHAELDDVFPEISELIKSSKMHDEITVLRNRKSFTLSVRIKLLGSVNKGYIITFDDISSLVDAQRSAAWSDVARRIAHEIKNPITPIYLAAERLSSKYQHEIISDKESFGRYIDTIIRHVTSIRCIVDEFAKFAKMSDPVLIKHDICSVVKELAFSGQFSRGVVHYELDIPSYPIFVVLDKNQINHVFINLFKNACESIDMKSNSIQGLIKISVVDDRDCVNVQIQDNGVGFPEELMEKLTEPYVTTRVQGTGLGLSIVKKILDEHNATISFYNIEDGGLVKLTFVKCQDCENI
ncbi:HAMP domain protein [Ehrlichia chaffeensis str. Heartland]|uniref:Putative sensor histidine kinase NtrY-like n=1 Tax=Ehrlichia chaffeensis (strain ATCC CRL-10679 / Arkansas) TaxID=205920 RepID=Q2GHG3_EHRCR|nr:ATP-binding protein [Ehrlichia chaffeensis]ABD45031.1 putative nitrogen regulation protein NtrY [Ehrlichia chaffeensis str. Arkansas]AHX03414.1 HAMP domain protein [Ehrlichia chaffeensis str. Heartland]AHX05865.1 HAMP domain protein [Ehrlichia chaffeensis str. Jax]AHX06856.1 HAMP domain protein [Ehrlichia chaffeensis str. Liberty]AHX07134.1 HAMP domain protein [Ehrlichia chaffeensis str. Osceola]